MIFIKKKTNASLATLKHTYYHDDINTQLINDIFTESSNDYDKSKLSNLISYLNSSSLFSLADQLHKKFQQNHQINISDLPPPPPPPPPSRMNLGRGSRAI